MLGGSSSTSTSGMTSNTSNSHTMSLKKEFPCNTCELVFENSQAQRAHMREPWHIHNLKRRMASLPSISAETYADEVATSLVANKKKSSNVVCSSPMVRSFSEDEGNEESDEVQPASGGQAPTDRCLFCAKESDGLEANTEHMSSEHGLYIPDIEHLSSLETTIRYLHTVINEYHECLYCGITKYSVQGIRRHMLDKGHCMINLEREPELLEFWELSDHDGSDIDDEEIPNSQVHETDARAPSDVSQGEYTLPSGKIIGSKSKARHARLSTRRTALAAKKTDGQMVIRSPTDQTINYPLTGTVESHNDTGIRKQNNAITVRDAAGLIGVSDQQLQSLTTIHRKMQRQQAIVHASRRWADELGGTHQKHYKQKMNLRDG